MQINFNPFSPGTVLFDQLPGVLFPATARVVATAAGERALSNAKPGEEFNSKPLRIDFIAAQSQVSMKAGLQSSSSVPIDATLRAFDVTGAQIAQDGPKQVGPGPVEANTIFAVEVSSPEIRRVELRYEGAFAELIDDLEFDVEGEVTPPDVIPPVVNILRPESGAMLTGESFILEANITEDRHLSEVTVTIAGNQGTMTFSASFFGQPPDYRVGPFRTQPLAMGNNVVTVTARDFAGNEGQATVRVIRVPLAARLVIDPEGPIVLERGRSRPVEVRLEETFSNSLDGRGEIDIQVVGPGGVHGQVRIRDFLNQPEPRDNLVIAADPTARLGGASVFLQAVEVDTDRIIATADLLASIVPANPMECDPIPFYAAVTPEVLRQEMQAGMDAALETPVSALTPLQLTFASGEIRIFRRFRIDLSLLAAAAGLPAIIPPIADINLFATIVRNPDVPFTLLSLIENASAWENVGEDQLPFTYGQFEVNASPNIEIITVLHAIAWAIAQAIFEAQFSDRVREKLICQFNERIYERITADDVGVLVFLRETRITVQEFMFGFCVSEESIPNPLRMNDFASDPLDEFESADDPGAVFSRPSNWSFDADGQSIVQTSNIHGPADHVNTRPDKPGTYLLGLPEQEETDENGEVHAITPWPVMRNFALECTLSSQDDDGIGLVFRYQNVDNFYFFLMDAQRRYRRIGKKVGGVFQELEAVALDTGNGFDVGTRHDILLIARHDTFSVYIDGILALTGSDPAIPEKGRIGFYAWGNTAARFDTLRVRPL